MSDQPQLHILAGPNGSGKSTYADAWIRDFVIHNPDEISKSLHSYQGNSLIQAGRIIRQRIDRDIANGTTFGIETTLSGHQVLRTMQKCKESGYSVYLHFIYVEKFSVSRARVAQRVSMGGHGVPEEDQMRRFPRSFENLPTALLLADMSMIFNNSYQSHQLVAVYDRGQAVYKTIDDHWLP